MRKVLAIFFWLIRMEYKKVIRDGIYLFRGRYLLTSRADKVAQAPAFEKPEVFYPAPSCM